MTIEEAIKTIEVAKAEVEWNYPMDYQIAFDMAIEALEYREPKKPTHKDTLHSSCSVCGEDAKVFWKFCPYCGQRLDWSDEE